jgi:uncharacterized Fe-S cluster protein YjdI
MDLKETGKGDVDWTDLSQNRHKYAGCCVHGNERLLFPKMPWIYSPAMELLASEAGS